MNSFWETRTKERKKDSHLDSLQKKEKKMKHEKHGD